MCNNVDGVSLAINVAWKRINRLPFLMSSYARVNTPTVTVIYIGNTL